MALSYSCLLTPLRPEDLVAFRLRVHRGRFACAFCSMPTRCPAWRGREPDRFGRAAAQLDVAALLEFTLEHNAVDARAYLRNRYAEVRPGSSVTTGTADLRTVTTETSAAAAPAVPVWRSRSRRGRPAPQAGSKVDSRMPPEKKASSGGGASERFPLLLHQ